MTGAEADPGPMEVEVLARSPNGVAYTTGPVRLRTGADPAEVCRMLRECITSWALAHTLRR